MRVILFRHDHYKPLIDDWLSVHKDRYECSFLVTSDIKDLNHLFDPNYHVLVTCGNAASEYNAIICPVLLNRFSPRWIYKSIADFQNISQFNLNVNYCYANFISHPRALHRPVFSVFTTCYKSWEKIKRAYASVKEQSMPDWEWVIIDDTDDAKHFDFLKTLAETDSRIRLYNRSKNSGNIGNVKNEAVSLCRGKYVLELDHDDEILPDCLKDAHEVFERDSTIGFVYMDFVNLFEDKKPYMYYPGCSQGYAGYYYQWYQSVKHDQSVSDRTGGWVPVYVSPDINNITLKLLVSCPNHPRMWRRSALMELENYPEHLPICDDFEIILRTCVKYRVAKVNKLAYVQYMNNGGNNFSLIRNQEINRLGPQYISPIFFTKFDINSNLKSRGAFEEWPTNDSTPVWKRGENYSLKKLNWRVNFDVKTQYCFIVKSRDFVESLDFKEKYEENQSELYILTNVISEEEMKEALTNFKKVKWMAMKDCTKDQLVRYFEMVLKNDNCNTQIFELK
jgi:glycosyltransferase involved in cell wall biosynthesis